MNGFTGKDLKKQHEILRILKNQYFLFYKGSNKEQKRIELLLTPENIAETLEMSRDESLKLLTNLISRGYANKESGDSWLYVISDDGIQAFLEEKLIYEGKQLRKDKLNKRTALIIALISLSISVATYFNNYIRTNTNDKEIMEVKQENKALKDRISVIENNQGLH